MFQWCSSSYWRFPGMCEMSQPSWGGGPVGSPPHARMTSFLPLMQLLPFFDISLHLLWCLFDLHVSVRACEPFPACRGHVGVFVSHVLKYYCISPDGYSRHRMYVRFIILFIWLMFRLAHASLLRSVVFWVPYSLYLLRSMVFRAPYSLYFVSAGIGMPPLPPLAQVPIHKLETCCTCKSHLLRD